LSKKERVGAIVAGETKVTRIKASDSPKKTIEPKNEQKTVASKEPKSPKKRSTNPIKAFGGYVKGAWQELKQVRWPTRRATWELTVAVLLFSLFFIVLISLLDVGFKALFELIIR
jgi:preprotein translocase subunit SecE